MALRGQRVVAGDHDRRDAGRTAGRDRRGRRRRAAGPPSRRPRRGGGRARRRRGRAGTSLDRALGEREHAVAVGGVALGDRSACRSRSASVGVEEWADRLERALHGDPTSVTGAVWMVVIRRRSGSNVSSSTRGQAAASSRADRRRASRRARAVRLGRIAADGPRVIAVPPGHEAMASLQAAATWARRSSAVVVRRLRLEPTGRARSRRRYAILAVRGPDPLDEHPVLGQRAGLVGADDASPTRGSRPPAASDERVRWAIRRAPSARAIVTTAGRPSGMAATARLTAVRNITSAGSPRAMPLTNTKMHTRNAATASHLPSVDEAPLERRRRRSCSSRSSATRPRAGLHAGRDDDAQPARRSPRCR